MGIDLQEKIKSTKHIIAAIGWICLFLYSVYFLVGRIVNSQPYLMFHIIVVFSLLLVSIRSVRRYLLIRRHNKKMSGEV